MKHGHHLERIQIEGFKSIEKCDLELKNINVLIGANGAGKSNFIGFFKLIQQMLEGNLQLTVGRSGGADALLHFGRKKTPSLKAELYFGNNGYKFSLEPTVGNQMIFSEECLYWNGKGDTCYGKGHIETQTLEKKIGGKIYDYSIPPMKKWQVYHFHDTSESATVKQIHGINDNLYLKHDAGNLGAYLFYLQQQCPEDFDKIQKIIRLVAPFFGKFLLRPEVNNPDRIQLEWFEKGEDTPFKAHYLSDGTLRFMCLATLLLQPSEKQPETIIIDEPELGLHPYAIKILAGLIKSVSTEKQVIISTQSVDLLSEFFPEDVIVVEREGKKSTFKRLQNEKYTEWLEDYSLGELWKQNILGGRPSS